MRRQIRVTITLCSVLAVASVGAPARAEGMRYLDPIFESLTATPNVVYGNAPTEEGVPTDLLLDLFAPEGDTETERPAIIFAHGGGFIGGSRTDAGIVTYAEAFAARGFVTASVSYRTRASLGYEELVIGSLGGELPEAMLDAKHDLQAAVRYLRANADSLGIDPNLIAVGGVSAGASMALEALFGADDPGSSNHLEVPSDVAAAIAVSGAADPRRATRAGPHIMFNGTNDTTAPYPTAYLTHSATTTYGNRGMLVTYIGEGHDLSEFADEIIQDSAARLCETILTCGT